LLFSQLWGNGLSHISAEDNVAPPRKKGTGRSGNQRFEITPQVLKKVEQLAAQQMLERDIAHCLKLSPQAFSLLKAAHAILDEAVRRGYSRGLAEVTKSLLNHAKNGQHAADRIFFLKCKGGWRDDGRDSQDTTDTSAAVAARIQDALEKFDERPEGAQDGAVGKVPD
jgi:hypothetical protein